jgi:uncharacterized MnhB-related membrane protein
MGNTPSFLVLVVSSLILLIAVVWVLQDRTYNSAIALLMAGVNFATAARNIKQHR